MATCTSRCMTSGGRGQPETGGGAVALRDANGDGRFEVKEPFGSGSTTGIALRNGYVYLAHPLTIERMQADQRDAEADRRGRDDRHRAAHRAQHEDKGIAFDGNGSLYINVGAPSNACQDPDRRPGVKGVEPCPLLDKHARHLEVRREQAGPDAGCRGTRFATGLRQMPAITWHDGALYIAMHNRDQLDVFWPEQLHGEGQRRAAGGAALSRGAGIGLRLAVLLLRLPDEEASCTNPEYGGDGKDGGPLREVHAAGGGVPGALGAGRHQVLHGLAVPGEVSRRRVHRVPRLVESLAAAAGRLQRDVPADGERQGDGRVRSVRRWLHRKTELMQPNDAVARPDGVAQAPDGSLYISESQKGKIWRVMYTGK